LGTNAFRDVSSEALWRVCADLTLETHRLRPTAHGLRKEMPSQDVVIDALRQELGSEANKILRNPLFQPMRPGRHEMALARTGQSQEVLRFDVFDHPAYKMMSAYAQWNNVQFVTRDW
jgi:hypothetical protein